MNKILGTVLAFVLLGMGYFYFYSIPVYTALQVQQMKWRGAEEKTQNGIQYFEKNFCVEPQNCQCVLLLHGLGDTVMTWKNLLTQDRDAFLKPVHFFAANMPGSMGSELLSKPVDYNVQNVARLLSQVFLPKCGSWVVVGNSFGGWMAAEMGLSDPRIKGLLLMDPAGLKKDYSHVIGFFLHPSPAEAKRFYKLTYANPLPLPDFIFDSLVTRLKSLPLSEQVLATRDEDYLDKQLPSMKVPVIYLWGDKDGVIPTAWAEDYHKITPSSELRIAKNCGHIPQKECFPEALKAFNDLLVKTAAVN